MSELDRYIEFKKLSPFWGWVLIVLATLSLLAFGMWVHFIVPDRPREWNYGSLPVTPAESVYSTLPPSPLKPDERVVPRLPEAKRLTPFVPPSDWNEEYTKEFLEKQGK